jgi:hypothetical protein
MLRNYPIQRSYLVLLAIGIRESSGFVAMIKVNIKHFIIVTLMYILDIYIAIHLTIIKK